MITFKASSKSLVETLKKAKAAVGRLSKTSKQVSAEFTITNSMLTIAVPGAIFALEGVSRGTCKATVSFLHFYQIVNDSKSKEIEILIERSIMKVAGVSISARTTFFETDSILRSVDLPVNYKDIDLLRLKYRGYTNEEIEFNNLAERMMLASTKVNDRLVASFNLLKEYGVTFAELEDLVNKKIKAID